uniref:Cyanocobalamin reductase (cyanide-eliminating) n=1 Tax=Strongyloides venezuelensis TaxID=75913 RepID=A0A0K0FFW6_STRVS
MFLKILLCCLISANNIFYQKLTNEDGYELYPFRFGHYNNFINDEFKIDEDDNSFCVLVISTPKWFTNAYAKFLKKSVEERKIKNYDEFQEKMPNPISECVNNDIDKATKAFIDYDLQIYYDHSMHPWKRKPYIIMASAGHAAGAAYYYSKELCPDLVPTDEERINSGKKKLIGIAMHSKYGGNFAFRAVLVFRNLLVPDFVPSIPTKALEDKETIANLIMSFNDHWMTGEYRNIGENDDFKYHDKYSELQLEYFSSPPPKRWEIIQKLIQI